MVVVAREDEDVDVWLGGGCKRAVAVDGVDGLDLVDEFFGHGGGCEMAMDYWGMEGVKIEGFE